MSGDNVVAKVMRRTNRPTKELTIYICKSCKVEQARKDYERALADGRRVLRSQRQAG